MGLMLALACAAAVPSAGCLITERPDYRAAPAYPPSIVTPATAAHPLDRIIVLTPPSGGDAGGGELVFDVVVREPNVNDDLEAKVFVNRVGNAANIPVSERIPANPAASRPGERPFQFVIPASALVEGQCNKIELVVASGFVGSFTPVDLDESARAVWWAGPAGVDLTSCNR